MAPEPPSSRKSLVRVPADGGSPPGNPGRRAAVAVFADGKNRNGLQDASLVLGNLMNAAHAVGLGSCWINRAKETFETPEGKALMKKWGIEGDWVGVGYCILGYAEGEYPVTM